MKKKDQGWHQDFFFYLLENGINIYRDAEVCKKSLERGDNSDLVKILDMKFGMFIKHPSETVDYTADVYKN